MPDWNVYYTQKEITDESPSIVLSDNRRYLNGQGSALDLACGFSTNGRYLASLGYQVEAWDASDVLVKKLNKYCQQKNINLIAERHDLEKNTFPKKQFDIVVVSHFLNRRLNSAIVELLKPGGLLFYQTFSGEKQDDIGPSNPDYRLKKNELLNMFSSLLILSYREDSNCSISKVALNSQALLVAKRECSGESIACR